MTSFSPTPVQCTYQLAASNAEFPAGNQTQHFILHLEQSELVKLSKLEGELRVTKGLSSHHRQLEGSYERNDDDLLVCFQWSPRTEATAATYYVMSKVD